MGRGRSRGSRRLLVTVLFTDIVGSTERAVELGDRRWRQLLASHHSFVRKQLKRFGGREIDTAGDGFFATFEQPARAVECAGALVEGLARLGIQIRAGVHMGEVEREADDVRGVAVHVGARIMSIAGPGEILVSSTVRDLMGGSDVRFEDRGFRELKGVPAQWHVFAVDVPSLEPSIEEAPATAAGPQPGTGLRARPAWIAAGAATVVVAAMVVVLATRGHGASPTPGAESPSSRVVPNNAALEIDPASGRVRRTIPGLVAGGPSAPARHIEVGEGGVWIDTGTTVQHVDPRNGAIHQIRAQTHVAAIAVGQGAIWAAGSLGITRISPATEKTEATILYDTGAGAPGSIAVLGGDVWTLVTDGRLLRINAGTNKKTGHYQVGSSGNDLAVSPGSLWVASAFEGLVSQVDPATGKVRKKIPVPGTLTRVVVGAHMIWALDKSAGVVTPIDPTTRSVGAPIRVGAEPVDMTFGLGAVWVANRGDGTITRIDPATLRPTTIAVGGSIAAIAVDPLVKSIWVYLTQPGVA
jgi:class 3 adenylate cyclase/streptogramin lyase